MKGKNATSKDRAKIVKKLSRFNSQIALKITKLVGSMWCAYFFAILALVSLPTAISSDNPLTIDSWIAQTFLQLVLLPVIIVGQNLQQDENKERSREDSLKIEELYEICKRLEARKI
tara:strand:- start:120 stop:470 length:351 start_codon:yes stop_codon:yes gene_type:complete